MAAGQEDGVGAQVKQRGEALFRVDQRGFTLALARDFANHPDHLGPAVTVMGQAAVDLQPVQATVGPANAMAHGLLHGLAIDHGLERLAGACAVFLGQQVEVVDVAGQRALRVETEQRLGAA
ncbi:hypothetical protein D3C79_667440 [compost metagenome]